MSYGFFIAADMPLEEVENPYHKSLSINEALAMGAVIDPEFLECVDDKDDPEGISWACTGLPFENGKIFNPEAADNFSLRDMSAVRCYSDLSYGVYVDWDSSLESISEGLIEYIRKLLLETSCVEIWHVWWGDCSDKVESKTLSIQELKPCHIVELKESPIFDPKFKTTYDGDYFLTFYCLKIIA